MLAEIKWQWDSLSSNWHRDRYYGTWNKINSRGCNMKRILASAAKRKAQKPDVLDETQVQDVSCLPQKSPTQASSAGFRIPWSLAGENKIKSAEARWVVCLSLLTCSGAQQEDKDGLLTKVLDGKVSLFTSNRAVQPLVAVAFPNKQRKCFWNFLFAFTLLPHSLLSHCCPESFCAKSFWLGSHFIAFNSFIFSQLNLI